MFFPSISIFVVFYVPTSLTSLYTSTYLFADDNKLQDFHYLVPLKRGQGAFTLLRGDYNLSVSKTGSCIHGNKPHIHNKIIPSIDFMSFTLCIVLC